MKQIKYVFWVALLVKILLAVLLPLTNDEAYYWVWSQNMQLSYYDHPPFVAWLYWLGNFVNFYGGSVRLPGVLLGQATLAVWLILLKPFLNDRQRLYWLLLALLSPLVGGSGIIVTPDVPLMFFYALSLWLFFKWSEVPSSMLSLAFGVSMGLGFSSKYMMVLFVLSLAPLLFLKPNLRKAFFKNWHLLVVGGLIGALPVWLWNVNHDFASLKFQAAHGLGHKVWKPSWTSEYILGQIGFIFPVILYWALKARRRLPLPFHLLAWVPLVFFLFTTTRGYVEANWPIEAYPAIFALAVCFWPINRRGIQVTLSIWAIALTGFALVILVQPSWAARMKFKEFHQFDAAVEASRNLQPLYARSYQMAAKLHFELHRPVYKIAGMNRIDFYDYLESSRPVAKSFYIVVEKGDRLPEAYSNYAKIETRAVDEQLEIWKMERQ